MLGVVAMIHCDRCARDFPTIHGFKTHCGIVHKNDFVCRECGLDYGSETFAQNPGQFRAFCSCKHRAEVVGGITKP